MFADMTQAQLETAIAAVDSAITRTLNAQSYQIGTRQLSRPSLKELQALRAGYVKQLLAVQGNDQGVVTFDAATTVGNED